MNYFFIILGFIFSAIGLVDFMGMFFQYDFTGVPWSPLVFFGIGWMLTRLGEFVTPKTEAAPPAVTSFDKELLEAKTALANGDKKNSAIIIDRILKQDYVNPTAWQLLYQILGDGKEFFAFQKEFTSKYYPDKLQLLSRNEAAPKKKPRSRALISTFMAFVGFYVTCSVGDQYLVNTAFSNPVFFILAALGVISIQFVVGVLFAELPSFRFGQVLRGAAAGLLFAMPQVFSSVMQFMHFSTSGITQIILIIVGGISGILAAVVIDLPRFRWGRVLFFAIAGFDLINYFYGGHVGVLWKAFFLAIGYGAFSRGAVGKLPNQK